MSEDVALAEGRRLATSVVADRDNLITREDGVYLLWYDDFSTSVSTSSRNYHC
jgi:hypothetical protein